jgi:5'-nucleotidase
MKEILYIDLDGVIVDVERYINETYKSEYIKANGIGTLIDNHVDIFNHSKPIPGAVAAFRQLAQRYDVYILSTAPWDNPDSWTAKRLWVEKHLGS